MHYTGQVFRPPFEANSLLLEVTAGCSHNACTFCTMYQNTPFRVSPLEDIEEDLREARRELKQVRRVFLVNADPFVLSAAKLKVIAERINDYFPEVETIAMYASVKNIMGKTDEELRELRALKINELNIGVETGMDEALLHLNKGFSLDEARTQLKRLKAAGIDWSANIILGAAGSKQWRENAQASAKLLNETQPSLIFVATLHADPGSKIYDEVQSGSFVENTLGECLTEELELIRNLELENCEFFGLHTSNVIPMDGQLPEQKQQLIDYLAAGIERIPEHVLNSRPQKGYEGRAIIR